MVTLISATELILELARSGAAAQASSGAMPPGHNGPYRDPETPVRNTAHWLVTFAWAHDRTGEDSFLSAVDRCAGYLASKAARPTGASFWHRQTGPKDRCNGLVGQAWTFEGLQEAGRKLASERYTQLAEEVFFAHRFSHRNGLWRRLEIDGRNLGYDGTFNHQLWFAAAAGSLNGREKEEIQRRVERFLDCLPSNLTILESGLIYHAILRPLSLRTWARMKAEAVLERIPMLGSGRSEKRSSKQQYVMSKSVGYHAFCMYAFARLRERFPAHECWASPLLARATDYMCGHRYKSEIVREDRYGFAYNPPGFEVPYALSRLTRLSDDEIAERSEWWLNEQLKRSFDSGTATLGNNTQDAVTLTARVYELTRLPYHLLQRIRVRVPIPRVTMTSSTVDHGT